MNRSMKLSSDLSIKAFLSQILECGEGKTKGKQIAVIGEPGAGRQHCCKL